MKLRISLRPFLIILIAASAIFGFLNQRSYVRRMAARQLFENGFTLAYDRSSTTRGWINEGFGGHRAVDKPPNSILDSPSKQSWLSVFGMLELANRIEVVDGNRTWIDQKAFDGFVNDDLKPIARLDGVKEVSLNWNSIDDVGLKYLSGLSSLKRLALDGCPVSDNGLKQVTNLKNIEHLSLAYTKVTDNGIIDLTKLQKSKYLSLEGTNVSSECLIHLGNLKNLETLKLSSTKICQANIDKIAQLNELEELYIADTAVSDLGQVLKDLPNLRWLVVDGTNLGDELIVALQSTSLDRLSVDRTNLSRKSFDLILRLELRNSFSGYESGSTLEQLDVIGDDIVSGRAITGQ